MLEKLIKDCILQEGPHTEAVNECEEEKVADRSCYGVASTPIPHPPALFGRGGGGGVESDHPVTVSVSDLFNLIHELFYLIVSPVLLRRRCKRVAGWVSGSPPEGILVAIWCAIFGSVCNWYISVILTWCLNLSK